MFDISHNTEMIHNKCILHILITQQKFPAAGEFVNYLRRKSKGGREGLLSVSRMRNENGKMRRSLTIRIRVIHEKI